MIFWYVITSIDSIGTKISKSLVNTVRNNRRYILLYSADLHYHKNFIILFEYHEENINLLFHKDKTHIINYYR